VSKSTTGFIHLKLKGEKTRMQTTKNFNTLIPQLLSTASTLLEIANVIGTRKQPSGRGVKRRGDRGVRNRKIAATTRRRSKVTTIPHTGTVKKTAAA